MDVSGFDAVWQAFAKPLVVRSGGLATATLEVVMTDTSLRRLVEERELATDPIYIELSVSRNPIMQRLTRRISFSPLLTPSIH